MNEGCVQRRRAMLAPVLSAPPPSKDATMEFLSCNSSNKESMATTQPVKWGGTNLSWKKNGHLLATATARRFSCDPQNHMTTIEACCFCTDDQVQIDWYFQEAMTILTSMVAGSSTPSELWPHEPNGKSPMTSSTSIRVTKWPMN